LPAISFLRIVLPPTRFLGETTDRRLCRTAPDRRSLVPDRDAP
jgi:hypothetical protein